MDRRDFLKIGTVGVATGAGCTAQKPSAAPPPTPVDMDAFLAHLDRTMSAIADGNPLARVLERVTTKPVVASSASVARAEDLYRKSLRSLFLVGSFRDLPEDARTHPELQARMWNGMKEMDDAVLGMSDHMAALTPAERARIGETLRGSELPMQVGEALDESASLLGVTTQRRVHLRSITSQVAWRMRSQPTATFIDESVARVRAVAERHHKLKLEEIAKGPALQVKYPNGAPGDRALTVGAIALGLGVVGTALGGALVAGSGSGVGIGLIMVTYGVIGIVLGLGILLVGLIQKAVN